MRRLALLPALTALLVLAGCTSVPEQYVLHATTDGGDATVEYLLDGVTTTIDLADGDEWSVTYDTPNPPFEFSVTITALSASEEQVVGCGINPPDVADDERDASNAVGPADTSITCSMDAQ